MGRVRALTISALAAGALTLGGGCLTADSDKGKAKKPDVTQPGVLPPPREAAPPAGAPGAVVPAGGVPTAGASGAHAAPVVPASGSSGAAAASPLSKIAAKFEKKFPATEMEVAWRNRIAYLPDPTRNGAMGPGLVGQMFLFGGPKLQPAEPDGVLTVDLVDKTPRPAGQSAAKSERWQFDTEMLKKLRATDETFGRSFVLFLPWPDYRPDITRVEISARYDPQHGFTLYSRPTVVTIDPSVPFGGPVWDGETNSTPLMPGMKAPQPFGGKPPQVPGEPKPAPRHSDAPIPIGGSQPVTPGGVSANVQPIPLASGNTPVGVVPNHIIPIGGPAGASAPGAATPAGGAAMPLAPTAPPPAASPAGAPGPLAPVAPPGPLAPAPVSHAAPVAPVGVPAGNAAPLAPVAPEGLPPLTLTIGR